MKRLAAGLGLLALLEAHAACATPVTIGKGQNVTTAQTLEDGESASIAAGGSLILPAGNGDVAVTLDGDASIDNAGIIRQDGGGRAIRDDSGHHSFTITNEAGALMQAADADVIQLHKGSNNVVFYNYGTLDSLNTSQGGAQAVDFNGVDEGSNALYNYAGAKILAFEADAVRPGINGSVYNDGLIQSRNAAGSTDGSDGIDAQENSGIIVSNDSHGIIEGARHGITGGNTDTSSDGSYTLQVSNAAGGVIQGDDGSGINVDGFNANEVVTIVNHGTITGNGISGDGDGVDVDGIVQLTNSGTIRSLNAHDDTSEGVTVGGGSIVNAGTIEGLNGDTGSGRGITLAGLDKDPDSGDAIPTEGIFADTTITNSGLIRGQSDAGIAVTGAGNGHTITITNLAGGIIEGGGAHAAAIDTGANAATIIDYGRITADTSGIAIDLGSGDSSVQILGAAAQIDGDILGGSGHSSLGITPGQGQSFSYDHAIGQFDHADIGAGTVILDGRGNQIGQTHVTGTLYVGDANAPQASLASQVTVAAGATLAGTGTVQGDVVSDGTLMPGAPTGTLTITGDYTQHADASVQIHARPDGTSGRLAVQGKASLDGQALVLAQDGAWAPQTRYTVLTAGQGVSGRFGSVRSSLAFLDPVLDYGRDDVTLSLQRNDVRFESVARTPNQRATAIAADALDFANAAYTGLTRLDAGAAPGAFDRLSGQLYASTRSALLDDSRQLRDTISRHLQAASAGAADDGSVWSSAWGHWGAYDGDRNSARLRANGSALVVGADRRLGGGSRLGLVLGHMQDSLNVERLDSSAHVTSTAVGLYAALGAGALHWQAGAAYAWHRIDAHRNIRYGSFADRTDGRYHAGTGQLYVDAGYDALRNAQAGLQPYLNVARVRLHSDGFTERGGDAALTVAGQSTDQTTATLGLRGHLQWASAGIVTHASLGWRRAWGTINAHSTQHFVGASDNFTVDGVAIARNALSAQLGLRFSVGRQAYVEVSYQGQFTHAADDQGGRLNFTWRF